MKISGGLIVCCGIELLQLKYACAIMRKVGFSLITYSDDWKDSMSYLTPFHSNPWTIDEFQFSPHEHTVPGETEEQLNAVSFCHPRKHFGEGGTRRLACELQSDLWNRAIEGNWIESWGGRIECQ